jgi:hypothetical protein
VQEKGVVLVFTKESPCFKCVFPAVAQGGSCEELGILNSASHIVASMAVVEVLKLLLGKKPEQGMLRLDAWSHTVEKLSVKKNPSCAVCKGDFKLLGAKSVGFTLQRCKTRKGISVKPKNNVRLNLSGMGKSFKVVLETPILVVLDRGGEIIVHDYGELLFKELSDIDEIKKIALEIYSACGVESAVIVEAE